MENKLTPIKELMEHCDKLILEGYNISAHSLRDWCEIIITKQEEEAGVKPKIYEIRFGDSTKALIQINNNTPSVLKAVNGYGNSIDADEITINEQPIEP